MKEIIKYNEMVFESIKHIGEDGGEFWYERSYNKYLDIKNGDIFQQL